MRSQLLTGLRMTIVMTLLAGAAYPAVVTWLAQRWFPAEAGGSLASHNGRVIGSWLVGQSFARPEYFQSRPSAVKYDASLSGGSNLGPTSRALVERVQADVKTFREQNPGFEGPIPADLLTASASGLDPHISPASAAAQAARVARARGASTSEIQALIDEFVEGRQFGLLGEPRVNVLLLNLALDRRFPMPGRERH